MILELAWGSVHVFTSYCRRYTGYASFTFLQVGSHHTDEDFAIRGKEPKDEVQIYTWKDATLRELTDLVCRKPTLFCFFSIVSPSILAAAVLYLINGCLLSG